MPKGKVSPERPAPKSARFYPPSFHSYALVPGTSLREDLDAALAEGHHGDTAFSPEERAMLHNILRLRELRVEDVMIPRADIEAVDITTTLGDLLEMFEKSGHSRMPVFAETLDDPRGMVHIRDVVNHITKISRVKAPRRICCPRTKGACSSQVQPSRMSILPRRSQN